MTKDASDEGKNFVLSSIQARPNWHLVERYGPCFVADDNSLYDLWSMDEHDREPLKKELDYLNFDKKKMEALTDIMAKMDEVRWCYKYDVHPEVWKPFLWNIHSAASCGALRIIKWLRENGCPWDEETCEYAAEKGHLEVLKWLRANGCPWNTYTCEYAADNGHLEILQWARANGCPWNEETCAYAAENGHLEILQWARANGCPWDEYTCSYAAKNGHFEILKWARANGCPWNEQTCEKAAENSHFEILQWARANGCPG